VNNADYSGATGSNKSFDVYTDIGSAIATESLAFNGYRWFVSNYGKDVSYSGSFANGVFAFNSNFAENRLESGTSDLVMLIGIDTTTDNITPDKFLFISDNPAVHPGRAAATTYSLDINGSISFTTGSITASIKKVWLYIGYKDSANGKALRLNSIDFSI
jgi:hypothetical protein